MSLRFHPTICCFSMTSFILASIRSFFPNFVSFLRGTCSFQLFKNSLLSFCCVLNIAINMWILQTCFNHKAISIYDRKIRIVHIEQILWLSGRDWNLYFCEGFPLCLLNQSFNSVFIFSRNKDQISAYCDPFGIDLIEDIDIVFPRKKAVLVKLFFSFRISTIRQQFFITTGARTEKTRALIILGKRNDYRFCIWSNKRQFRSKNVINRWFPFLPASLPASSVLRITVLTTHWKKAGRLDRPKIVKGAARAPMFYMLTVFTLCF